jgi:hypothetical protein
VGRSRMRGGVDRTEGDAFIVFFGDAVAAGRAAVAAQRALRAHRWPEAVGELRVRMGLHVGKVQRTEVGYLGLEVHRAARVAAAAHAVEVPPRHGRLWGSDASAEADRCDRSGRHARERRWRGSSLPTCHEPAAPNVHLLSAPVPTGNGSTAHECGADSLREAVSATMSAQYHRRAPSATGAEAGHPCIPGRRVLK